MMPLAKPRVAFDSPMPQTGGRRRSERKGEPPGMSSSYGAYCSIGENLRGARWKFPGALCFAGPRSGDRFNLAGLPATRLELASH
jgi:hypothetical protein